MKNINKKNYSKPVINRINIDNTAAIQMMSEGSVPDDPPWVKNDKVSNTQKDPYKGISA